MHWIPILGMFLTERKLAQLGWNPGRMSKEDVDLLEAFGQLPILGEFYLARIITGLTTGIGGGLFVVWATCR